MLLWQSVRTSFHGFTWNSSPRNGGKENRDSCGCTKKENLPDRLPRKRKDMKTGTSLLRGELVLSQEAADAASIHSQVQKLRAPRYLRTERFDLPRRNDAVSVTPLQIWRGREYGSGFRRGKVVSLTTENATFLKCREVPASRTRDKLPD
jgi:hypothetical protein